MLLPCLASSAMMQYISYFAPTSMPRVGSSMINTTGILGVLSIADNVSIASLNQYLIGGMMLDDGKIEKLAPWFSLLLTQIGWPEP